MRVRLVLCVKTSNLTFVGKRHLAKESRDTRLIVIASREKDLGSGFCCPMAVLNHGKVVALSQLTALRVVVGLSRAIHIQLIARTRYNRER
jgi:hypothetical protein